MAFRDTNDLGIVLYLKGTPGGATYVDIQDQTQNVAVLDGTYRAMPAAVTTAHPNVSAAGAASMFVVVGGLTGGQTVTVRCRQAYYNANANFAGPAFFSMMWARQDTTTDQVAIEFELTANGTYLIQTPGAFLGDELEFSAKTNEADPDNIFVVIGCKVGS